METTSSYIEQKVELIKEIGYRIDTTNMDYSMLEDVNYIIRFNDDVILKSSNEHRTEKIYYWILSNPSILKKRQEILHSAIYYVSSEDISNKTN